MTKESKKTIDLAEIIAPVISSRDVIEDLEKVVLKTDARSVDLNFAKVEFVSRSAAHALLKIKENLQRRILNKKVIFFTNTNKDVAEMLRIVAPHKVAPRKSVKVFKAERIDINTLLKECPAG